MSDNELDSDFDDDNTMDTDDKALDSEAEKLLLSSGSDGSDSDSDDAEMDAEDAAQSQLLQKYFQTLDKIDKNKFSYDDYVILINLAHELSDLEKIRQSSDLFASVYPLAPDIWLKRLKIEMNIATTENEYKKVHQMFKRALSDYFSFDVALEYANFAFKTTKAETIWQELISTYSLDCMNGRALFTAWRTYLTEKSSETDDKYQKLINTYEIELSIPLYNMEESYIELKVLAEKDKEHYHNIDWVKLDKNYAAAKEQLEIMLPFEQKLIKIEKKDHEKRTEIYLQYIDATQTHLSNQIVQVLYERMITDCCLNPTCWLKYLQYMQNRDNHRAEPQTITGDPPIVFSQTDWDVVNRSLRNCTWSADLYVEKMRIAEKMEFPREDVQGIAEFALGAGFNWPEPVVTIWLEYLSYVRRTTNYDKENEIELLRATFTLAWDTLGRQFGEKADQTCEILQMWGRLEYGPLNDLAKGKELWTTVMSSADNDQKSGLWIEFAYLELKKGVDGARKIFRKAIAIQSMDNIYVIVSAWIRFERCYGTLDQLKLCQEKCKERLELEEPQLSTENNSTESSFGDRSKGIKRKHFDRGRGGGNAVTGNRSTMRKRQTDNGEANLSRNSNEQFQWPKKSLNNNKKPKADDQRKSSPPPLPPANKRPRLENVAEIHDTQMIDTSKDNVTIFLSNLDYNVTVENIIAAFPEFDIKHVNIIKTANGKSRGFGYVLLPSEADVEKCLSFDRRLILNRPTFISSVLRDKQQRGKFKYSEDIEPTKLFVKGLPFDATKDELEQIFSKFGPLKDVRLVQHKSGKFKGIAYIEYENESSASAAVLKMDLFELRNLKMSVAISAPPPRPSTASKGHASAANMVGLGEGRRTKVQQQGEIKPRLSFIPRSVQKSVLAVSKMSIDGNTASEPTTAKTNADFRKLLEK